MSVSLELPKNDVVELEFSRGERRNLTFSDAKARFVDLILRKPYFTDSITAKILAVHNQNHNGFGLIQVKELIVHA